MAADFSSPGYSSLAGLVNATRQLLVWRASADATTLSTFNTVQWFNEHISISLCGCVMEPSLRTQERELCEERQASSLLREEQSQAKKIYMYIISLPLKVTSGQIGSAWEWYNWIGLEKDINCNRIFLFSFWSWICKNESNLLLVWIMVCLCSKLRSFPPNHAPKMRKRHQLFFGLRHLSIGFQHPAIQTKIEQHFGGFLLQIKVRQPIGRQESMQTVGTSRRLDSF